MPKLKHKPLHLNKTQQRALEAACIACVMEAKTLVSIALATTLRPPLDWGKCDKKTPLKDGIVLRTYNVKKLLAWMKKMKYTEYTYEMIVSSITATAQMYAMNQMFCNYSLKKFDIKGIEDDK